MTGFTIGNGSGLRISGFSIGASIASIEVRDAPGQIRDVALGLERETDYADNPTYLGSVVGRTAGRVWPSTIPWAGGTLILPVNEGRDCHLHGGPDGWHTRDWEIAARCEDEITFRHLSHNGESGYPGTVDALVRYTVTQDDRWVVEFAASSDAPTPISLTQHCYFNLSGDPLRTVSDHLLQIDSDELIELGAHKTATGRLTDLSGTLLDFRQTASLGERLAHVGSDPSGLDHCFSIRHAPRARGLSKAARIACPDSGIALEVWTDQPALHVYSGNYLDGSVVGKGGAAYHRHTALCLETQEHPNAVNHTSLKRSIVSPGNPYHRRVEYRFGHSASR